MHASIPVGAGVPFDLLNPRMDSQNPTATIPIYAVNGKPYLTPGEADRVAESLSTKWNQTAEIRFGEIPFNSLQVLRTVPAAGSEPVTVESVPSDNAGIPNAPSGTLKTLPESGLFSLEAWAATLNMSVETVQHLAHRYGIATTDGRIDAANWWRTMATAKTRVRKDLRGVIANLSGEQYNLLASTMNRAAESVIVAIENEAEDMIYGVGMHGSIGDEPSRPATDEECCVWNCSLNADGQFDSREALPEQVAAWLRETASQLMDAAERIAAIEDDRDLELMRRYVAGDQGIIFDHESATFAELDAA